MRLAQISASRDKWREKAKQKTVRLKEVKRQKESWKARALAAEAKGRLLEEMQSTAIT